MPQNSRPSILGDWRYRDASIKEIQEAQNQWDLLAAQEEANRIAKQRLDQEMELKREIAEERKYAEERERLERELRYKENMCEKLNLNYNQVKEFLDNIYHTAEINDIDFAIYKLEFAQKYQPEPKGIPIGLILFMVILWIILGVIPFFCRSFDMDNMGRYIRIMTVVLFIVTMILTPIINKASVNSYWTQNKINPKEIPEKLNELYMKKDKILYNNNKDFNEFRVNHYNLEAEEILRIVDTDILYVDEKNIKKNGIKSDYTKYIVQCINKVKEYEDKGSISIGESKTKKSKSIEYKADKINDDPLLMEAIQSAIETGQASASFIEKKFNIGYARAGRIIDQMEEKGIVSGYKGSKPREILITREEWKKIKNV